MGLLRINRLKLNTRIAISFGILLFIIAFSLLIYINYSVQKSMEKDPIIQKIAPYSTSVTVNQQVTLNDYNNWGNNNGTPELMQQTEVQANQLDRMFSLEVLKRMTRFSLIGAAIIGLLTFAICYYLPKRLMRPLADIASMTSRINPQNLTLRLKPRSNNDEISRLSYSYNNTLDRLQNAFSDLEQFNSYASHELRNSLSLLRTCLDTGPATTGYENTLKQASSYISRISKNIDDMLALSSKQLKDANEPVDLALLAAQAVDEYTVSGREIRLLIPEEGVMPVNGKEIWLYRVISNLIDNALKYSDKNSPIIVAVEQVNYAVTVKVRDEGPGIDQFLLDNIWEPYYSFPASNRKGIGLGLAMVRHVVDLCGGIVWVDSETGKGSTFSITIPAMA